jgi:ADP-L-glycero-D-manno-heptose 6-epimerase
MKALVTGNVGFIGSQMQKYLESNNHIVVGIDKEYLDIKSWRHVLKNLLSSSSPDVVFHIGACSDTLERDVNYMMNLNYESTKIIADFCSENQIPLIYSSSAANYGIEGLCPSNLYGWSKYCAEDYVISKGGIALRYFNVYGPGESHKGEMSSLAYQMFLKKKNKENVLLFPKDPKRDFVYIKDVISSNIYACNNYSKLKGRYYHVGSGTAESFEKMMNLMNIEFEYHEESKIPKGYQFFTCSNKDMWLNGWLPLYDLQEGIEDYKKFLEVYK